MSKSRFLLSYAALKAGLSGETWRRHRRVREVEDSLPQWVDLMVLCLEAGYSLDQALRRTAQELAQFAPALAAELAQMERELNAGAGQVRALEQMARRVPAPALLGLVRLLVQAERFGTRVSEALLAQSEYLRIQRRELRERRAATLGIRLLFPLVFCIFPALLLVLVGPALLGLARALAVSVV